MLLILCDLYILQGFLPLCSQSRVVCLLGPLCIYLLPMCCYLLFHTIRLRPRLFRREC